MTLMDGIQYATGIGMIAGFGSQLLYKPEAFAKRGTVKPPVHIVIPFIVLGILILFVNAEGFEFLCYLALPMSFWAISRMSALNRRTVQPSH
ncbi:MAG: hypothetical protein IT432_10505 [Phycisphaerales bacterium]|nr:hypothetical protein [Phycisphaerales bacterium]